MMMNKVLLVGNTELLSGLSATLQAINYSLVADLNSLRNITAELFTSGATTLVASMRELSNDDLNQLLSIQEESPVTTVLHLETADSQTTRKLAAAGIGALVVGALEVARLPQLLDLAEARLTQLQEMRAQIADLQQTLQDRKAIDRAKGLIMGKGKYSEEQAYHALRKLAMSQNQTMGQVAAGVISSAELFA